MQQPGVRTGLWGSLLITLVAVRAEGVLAEENFLPLFDGRTLQGWEGDPKWFRVQDGAIVGGSLDRAVPHNFFLCSQREFADFELRLEFKLIGRETNAGIQIRSQRIPNHHEVRGYQADLGQNYWGCLYDESRRNRVLAGPDPKAWEKFIRVEDWNEYRIVCDGPRIRLWINGQPTVDYEEEDPNIPQRGLIALQIHGGPPGEAAYRQIRIRPLGLEEKSE